MKLPFKIMPLITWYSFWDITDIQTLWFYNIDSTFLSLCLPASPCGEGEMFAADPDNKCKYFECDTAGNVHHMSCSPGTKWDEVTKTCVYLAEGESCDGSGEYI